MKLLQYAWSHIDDLTETDYHLAWFNNLYDHILNLKDYKNIIMIITELNIAAQLFYLKKLIKEYKNCNVWTRWIHLI